MDFLKVVAVASSEETRAALHAQLQGIDFIRFDGVYIELSDAVRKCQALQPDVIIVEMTGRELDTGLFIGAIGMNPENPCVILALHREMDLDTFKEAMSKGAKDFIQYPADKQALETALRKHRLFVSKVTIGAKTALGDAAAAREAAAAGRIVCVFASKGGAGASTVAVNLAYELLQLKKQPVVVLDLDQVFCNSSVMLKLRPDFSMGDLCQSDADDVDEEMVKRIVAQHETGLHLVAGSKSVLDDNDMISAELLETVLDHLVASYAWIIVDLPTHVLDPYHQYMVERADLILLLSCPDVPSLSRTRQYLDLAQNYLDMSKVKLVMNRATIKGAYGMKSEEMEEQFRYEIYGRLVDDWDLNVNANSMGQFWSRINPQSELARGIQRLAVQVSGNESDVVQSTPQAAGGSGLLGKLFGSSDKNTKKDSKGNVIRKTKQMGI